MNKIVLLLLVAFNLSSCSSVENVNAVHFKHFDFAKVTTYSTFDRNTGFSAEQNITDSDRNKIELAIDKAMLARGLSFTTNENADLMVTYHLIGQNRDEYIAYNKAVRFCFTCIQASTWESKNENWSIEFGSLVIDFVDPKSHRSVWRNIYPLQLEVDDNSRQSNIKINQAVKALISKYPL